MWASGFGSECVKGGNWFPKACWPLWRGACAHLCPAPAAGPGWTRLGAGAFPGSDTQGPGTQGQMLVSVSRAHTCLTFAPSRALETASRPSCPSSLGCFSPCLPWCVTLTHSFVLREGKAQGGHLPGGSGPIPVLRRPPDTGYPAPLWGGEACPRPAVALEVFSKCLASLRSTSHTESASCPQTCVETASLSVSVASHLNSLCRFRGSHCPSLDFSSGTQSSHDIDPLTPAPH